MFLDGCFEEHGRKSTMLRRTSRHVCITLTTTFLTVIAGTTAAMNVTVTEVGGQGLSVTGELLSYDGETYHMRTSLGDIQLDVLGSICAGEGCPEFSEDAPGLVVAGNRVSKRLPSIVNSN